nr:uncharacterized protein LOC109422104 [Aedes albopictus]
MEKLVKIRNAHMVQVVGELAAAGKLAERKASCSEATERLDQLRELAGNFRRTQSSIEESLDDPEAVASVHNFREEFNGAYFRAKDILEKYIADNNPDEVASTSSFTSGRTVMDNDLREAMKMLLNAQRTLLEGQQTANINQSQGTRDPTAEDYGSNRAPFVNVRLPPINVPTFSGDRKSWRSFKDIFETTIHNRIDLPSSLKMQYLVSFLDGSAKQLVSSFPISEANYLEAWEALTNVYDKKKYTVFALVREFVGQPAVTSGTSESLRKLVTTSDEVVRQLNALGEEFNTRDPWLIHLLLEKLDKESRSHWAQRIIEEENPSFDDFLKFLDNRCDALETCTAFAKKSTGEAVKKETVKKTMSEKKLHSLHSAAGGEKCAKCSKEHPLFQCDDFKKMDTQSKRELVKKARLCFNCLRASHTAKFCGSKAVCRNDDCKQRHHTLLCEKNIEEVKKKPVLNSETEQQESGSVITSMVAQVPLKVHQKAFILPTAVIRVRGGSGELLQARALIDSGSEASLISEACVQKLGLPRSNGKVVVSGLGQQTAGTTRGLVKLVIANRFENAIVLQTSAFVMGRLTSTLPTQHCRVHPSLLDNQLQENLADPAYQTPGPIDIILGSDVFLALLKPGQVKDNGGVPVAQNTIFGWIVSGNQAIYSSKIQANASIVNLHTELDVNRTLRMFWEQEEVPKPQQLTPSEQTAAELSRSTLTRDGNGRFIVRLPFDDSKPALGESLTPAIKRLRSMERRFRQDKEFHKQYTEFLRKIVFREQEDQPIQHYRMCTVTYGTKCAPYLAIEAMKQSGREYKEVYPEAALRIELDTYVDDFLSGAKDVQKARDLKQQVVEILESAGFHLRKWTMNCPELLQDEAQDEQEPVDVKLAEQPNAVKALGIRVNTKRQLLSDSCKLFDPFGWLAPVTVKVKIIFQQLWLSELSWDDPLPPAVESAWIEVKETLQQVEQTRVAPIKQVSLPRLELNAAALLSTLMESVMQAFSHLEVEPWAYTDSSIVLQWLSAHPRKWKTYVANRTSAILEVLPRDRWNHVRSEDNPADCASRGLTPGELVTHPLWWCGPDELKSETEHWKRVPVEQVDDEELLELRRLKVLHTAIPIIRTNYDIETSLLERRSNYTLIVRTLAYVNRFLLALKADNENLNLGLSPNEIYDAKMQLARAAQYAAYKPELELLQKGNELPPKHKLSALHPFLDSQGTMRVGGRLQNSAYPYDVKHPAILPANHKVTELLLRDIHLRNLHAGPNLLTATVNQHSRMYSLRATQREDSVTAHGSLPVPRVTGTRAFTHVGVDYAGPLKVHASCVRGVKTTKGYIVVFVCMATKAVHLEVASDLSTNTFICALKRFISRRSHPNEIWSDCGTNFVGTDHWLKEIQDVRHIPMNRLDKWQLLHKHTTEIWKRWRDEYVSSLQPRSKWRTTEANVEKDKLVLVKNDNAPPAHWELARIVQLHPDSTGVVRTVTLRRGQAEYSRPIQKICVLPSD